MAHCNKVDWKVPGGKNHYCLIHPFFFSFITKSYFRITHFRPDATPRPGGNSCTWGPSYWCAKPENAKACGEEVIFLKNEECTFDTRQLLIDIIYLKAVAHCKKIKDASGLSNHVAPEFLMIYSLAAGLLLLITNL